jgi:hypothetical protein
MNRTWRTLPIWLLLAPGAASAAEREERIGDWAYRMTGNGQDAAGFAASADAPGKGSIVFGCDAPGPGSVYVSFIAREYLGGVRAIKRLLQLKVDDGPLVTREWEYDKNVAYDRERKQTRQLARQLKGAHSLVIRASTWKFETIEATIPVDGAEQALTRLYRDCGNGEAP